MSNVVDSILASLGPQQLGAIAQQLGASPEQARRGVEAALPLIVGQLSRNAATPDGADALARAVQRDHAAGPGLGDLLGGLLGGLGGAGGGAGNGALADGAAILGHVFGGKQARVNDGVSQVSGLGGAQVAQLLALLAPLVMRALGQQTQAQAQGRGAGGIDFGDLLGRAAGGSGGGGSGGGLLGALLDRDGDGDVDLSDLAKSGDLLGGLFGKR